MSDRPEDRPVPPLARASARNARTQANGTDDGTSTQRRTTAPAKRRSRPDREAVRTPRAAVPGKKEVTNYKRHAKPRTGSLGGSNRMLSAREVAAILGIPERTVREKWRDWELPAYRIGKHLRWKEREVYAWIDRNTA